MTRLQTPERRTIQELRELSDDAGSHSPSIHCIEEQLPQIDIQVDACFLSNPHATDLFMRHLRRDLLGGASEAGELRDSPLRRRLEFYPSQNRVIADNLARALDVDADRIFVGNGATEIIQAVLHNFCRERCLINLPTFSAYYEFAHEGVEVVHHHLKPTKAFALDIDDWLATVRREQPDTVVLINPNNPTGGYLPESAVIALLDELRDVDTVVLDESFIHFAFESGDLKRRSVMKQVEDHDNLVVVKSMSKDFGVAGIRAGYAVMAPQRVRSLLDNGYLWNLSGLAEYFFDKYADPAFQREYEPLRLRYIQDTQDFFRQLSQVDGLRVFPSKANFALAQLTTGISAFDFSSRMLVKHGVYLRNCDDKIGLDGEFVRIASRTPRENARVLDATRQVLDGWGSDRPH